MTTQIIVATQSEKEEWLQKLHNTIISSKKQLQKGQVGQIN